MSLFSSFVRPVAAIGTLGASEGINSLMGGGLFGDGDKGGFDMSGAPQRPGFQSLLKTDDKGKYTSFALPEELQRKDIVGQEGRDALKSRALATGRSPWADMMIQKQKMEEANQLGDVSKEGNSSLQQAQGSVARTGGLHSGVGANLASQNMRDQMLQKQQVRQAGFGNRLGIDLQDDQTKMGMLQNLQNQDQNSSQFNITNSIAEKRAKDVADITAYSEQMKGWAAGKQGQAIQNSGKK